MKAGFRITSFDQVTSTNDVIKEAAASGAPEGLVVIAKTQRSGYGQRGNHWDSPLGGIYLSMLLRPDKPAEKVKEMGQVAAVAVMRALAGVLPSEELVRIAFKWPNDIIVPDEFAGTDAGGSGTTYRKLCGISTELKDGCLCLGIGVNGFRNEKSSDAATDGNNRLVHLEDLGISCDQVKLNKIARLVAEHVWQAYKQWLGEGFEPFRSEYSARLRPEDQVNLRAKL